MGQTLVGSLHGTTSKLGSKGAGVNFHLRWEKQLLKLGFLAYCIGMGQASLT